MAKIVLTFDDGWSSHYKIVRPVLLQHGFGATFFITADWIIRADRDTITVKQLQMMHADGFEIGNHLLHHVDMTKLSDQEMSTEIVGCEHHFTKWGLDNAVSLAYPGFHCDDRVRGIVKAWNYRFGRAGLGVDGYEFTYLRGGSGHEYKGDPMNVNCRGIFGGHYGLPEFQRDLDATQECGVFTFHDIGGEGDIHSSEKTFLQCMGYLHETGHEVVSLKDMRP